MRVFTRMAPPQLLQLRSAFPESSTWQLGEPPHFYELGRDAYYELMPNLASRVCGLGPMPPPA